MKVRAHEYCFKVCFHVALICLDQEEKAHSISPPRPSASPLSAFLRTLVISVDGWQLCRMGCIQLQAVTLKAPAAPTTLRYKTKTNSVARSPRANYTD
jgi:hypothetical protein